MENERDDPGLIAREVMAALQDAHFAARRLEQLVAPPIANRPADRIHALRVAATILAAQIERALNARDQVRVFAHAPDSGVPVRKGASSLRAAPRQLQA